MNKLKLGLVAVLLSFVMASQSYAWFAADAKTTEGAASVKIPAYNNSGGTLDAGDVVVADFSSSTGDNDLYVTTTTTADTGRVVGVVWPDSIAAASSGSVVVYGFAECDVSATGVGVNGAICTSTTAGSGDTCASQTAGYRYAIANIAGGNTQISCFVKP